MGDQSNTIDLPAPSLPDVNPAARTAPESSPTPATTPATSAATLQPTGQSLPTLPTLPKVGSPSPTPPATRPTPVLTGPDQPATPPSVMLPTLNATVPMTDPNAPALPTLPTKAPVPAPLIDPEPLANLVQAIEDTELPDIPREHPMAHLMPPVTKTSESARQIAQQRADKKKKARRIKLALLAGFVVLAVTVGPRLAGWVSDAINDSGSTGTEEIPDSETLLNTVNP